MSKIIRFPIKKNKKSDLVVTTIKHDPDHIEKTKQNEHAVLVLSLISVLIAAIFVNDHMIRQQNYNNIIAGGDTQFSGRNVANILEDGGDGENLPHMLRDIEWEHSLANKLSSKENGVFGGIAQKPTALDDLKFGYLEGRYHIHQSKGLISEIEFMESPSIVNNFSGVKKIEDLEKFLINYKKSLGIDFKSLKKISSTKLEKSGTSYDEEIYEIEGLGNGPNKKAIFKIDLNKNFLNLKIQ